MKSIYQMEQNKNILDSLAPSLDDIFKRHLTFMHGAYPDDSFLNGFQGLLLGSFQQLSTIEKLFVLESGMNLILAEDVFFFFENLMNAWNVTKRSCQEINSDKTKNTIYLIQIVENYCNVFRIAKMSGWHFALFCKKHKIYLNDKEVREQGESVFEEELYNVIKDIDADEEFTFSKEFNLVHKQAWMNGYFTGFTTSEEGKEIKDHLLISSGFVRETGLSGRAKLLKILEDMKNQEKKVEPASDSLEIEDDTSYDELEDAFEGEEDLYDDWLNS